MKTVSILQCDREDHQFYPSFVIENDLDGLDNECAFDEVILQPSEEWMADYLQWNRFGRLPDDPAEDISEEDDPSSLIPTFQSLEEVHQFNAQGYELTRRLQTELEEARKNSTDQLSCAIQVAPFKPLYSNMAVGPVSAWWHVKDLNYGLFVPVQRLPVSDQLKSRLQAFRCHKGMEFWKFNDPTTMEALQQECRELQEDMLQEICPSEEGGKESRIKENATAVSRVESHASIGAMLEQSCTLVASATPTALTVERAKRIPLVQARAQ